MADHTDFGSVATSAGTVVRTFSITNSGIDPLQLTNITMTGAHAGDFTPGGLALPATLASGASTTFTVTFDPSVTGLRTATVNIVNDDSDEALYDFAIQGTGTNAPPVLTLPASPVLAEATSASGAVVNFTVSATDPEDGSLTPISLPPSPSLFPLGDTTVNVSATDSASATTSGSFTVRVLDTTAPVVSVPADILAEATSAAGAAVSFSVSAVDLVDGSVTASATPASGSTFAPGTNLVTVTAQDTRGNSATNTFRIVVVNAPNLGVTRGAVEVTNGVSAFQLGVVLLGQSVSNTFTITNRGTADLTLTNPGAGAVQLSGDTNDFVVVLDAPVTVPSFTSAEFKIRFTPVSVGVKSVTVRLDSNDADATPFQFTLAGTGNNASLPLDDCDGTTNDAPAFIRHTKLLANDADPDGEPLTVVAVSATSTNGGSVTLGATNVTYTPAPGFIGADAFTYTVRDVRGSESTATVSMTVLDGSAPELNRAETLRGASGPLVRFHGLPCHEYTLFRSLIPEGPYLPIGLFTATPAGLIEHLDLTPLTNIVTVTSSTDTNHITTYTTNTSFSTVFFRVRGPENE